MSVVKVELTTDGLFFTLGKMILPFREIVLLVPFMFGGIVLYCTVVVATGPDVGAFVVAVDFDGYVVVGIGGSV